MPRIKVKKRTLARRVNLWGSRITAFAVLVMAAVAVFSWLHKGKSHAARMSESEPGAASNGSVVQAASLALAANLASLLAETNWDRAMSQPNLLEILHFPGNLDWSKDTLELSPSENARLKLAMQAVDFEGGPCWLAGALLDQVMKANSNNPAARIVTARIALLRKDFGRTEELLRASAKLEPTNYWHRLNLAACQLLQPKGALVLSEARGVLQTLCAKAEVSHHARLLLALDGLRTNHVVRGQEDVYALFQPSASKMEDRLLELAQARAAGSPFPTNTLDNLEREAASQPWEVCALALWMARAGQAGGAIRWMESLPAQTVLQPPVGLALYLCAEEAEDWLLVEQRLQKSRWEEADFLRLALLAKTSEQCKHRSERDSFWNGAIQVSAKSFGAHVTLYGLARAWAWPERAEAML
ncbi:MAG: hypothetical protein NTW03_18525, partial [Verrucomicrobia bacterium]|nr:hypothetical protein [Verrucomicrobiota bacterium]